MPADRQDLRRKLLETAAAQSGYFTAAEARAAGYSYQAQHHHAQRGNWLRIDRGLFRLFEWPAGQHDDLVRWTLWSKRHAVVSHQSALDVHGIGEFNPARVHLTVPHGFSKKADGIVLHRADLDPADIQQREGFRVTTALRSLIDVASTDPDAEQLGRAITEARDAGQITIRQIRERAEAIDVKGALRIEQALGSLSL